MYNIYTCFTEFKSIYSPKEKESDGEKITIESIVSAMDSNKDLLISLKEKLNALEEEMYLANSNNTLIQDDFKVLNKSVQQILNKINLTQASMSSLSMYCCE